MILAGRMCSHRVGGNRKRNQQSTNADRKSIETAFLIAICRQWGDKWQSKTLFTLLSELHVKISLHVITSHFTCYYV